MSKRLFGFLAAALLAVTFAAPALAQDGTPMPAGPLMTAAELGLPEIQIEITDDGLVGPAEAAAGRYLVTVTNSSQGEGSSPNFIQIPEGETIDDLNAKFQAIIESFSASTPPADDPFAFLYEATLAGGVSAPPGGAGQTIVDLQPGSWAIWDEGFALPAVALNVTGEMPADLPEPEVSATITEVIAEDHFDFQIDGQIVSGPQIIRIVNDADQPHFVEFAGAPEGVTFTEEDVLALISLEEGATPDPALGLPNPEEVTFPAFAGVQSPDTTQWLIASFEPGSYATLCFVGDPRAEGAPHSVLGMIEVFEVA